MAVPRSGCSITSPTGIRMRRSGRITQKMRETFAGSSQW